MSSDASALPSFDQFGLHPDLLRAVLECGYSTATPIQAQAIPHVIAGRDVMGAAQTGTGKTAAFSLPILQRLTPHANSSASPARHPIRALILSPTRELADQIAVNVAQYAKYSPLRSAVVYGGVDINPQIQVLRTGVEVLTATPGRLLDHVGQKTVNLSQVQVLVLDEADRMLDMGFLPDLQRILNLLPEQRQSLLFSATFSPEIRKLANSYLRNPVSVEVAARNAAAETVTQRVYKLDSVEDKRHAVGQLFREHSLGQAIVFTNTKLGASRLARLLEKDGFKAEAIHGDKSQLERLKTLEAFKAGELELLVATDVAARGLDIAELPGVFNFDLPYAPEDYVHRIGRTGRAGASGVALSLMTSDDDKLLAEIEKLVKRPIQRAEVVVPRQERAPRESRYGRDGSSNNRYETRGDGRGESRSDARDSRPDGRSDNRYNRGERDTEGGYRVRRRDFEEGSRTRRLDLPPPPPRFADDDFFNRPYQAGDASESDYRDNGSVAAATLAEPRTVAGSRRPARPLPALLGGLIKRSSNR